MSFFAEEPSVIARLRAAGCVFAEEEAGLLVSAADSPAELESMLERRTSGWPVEQVVGWAQFCGLRIAVGPGVFVPRRRTEFLAAEALARTAPDAVVVDLCCGSAAVGAVLRTTLPEIDLYAADVEPDAVLCARCNLQSGQVYQGDLFDALPPELLGRVDVLVANVPYVPTEEIELLPAEARLHEPRVALDGGRDGLDVLRRVVAAAPRWLAPGGHLLVETSERQAADAVAIIVRSGLSAHRTSDDELGATVVIGTRGN